MSYSEKIALAQKLIEEHNAALEQSDDKIVFTDFEKKLKKLGGTTEDALKECTWEDLQDAGLGRILARKVAQIFRSESKPDPKYVSAKQAAQMHPLYLLQAYSPLDPSSAVAKRLNEMSRGQKFVVFNTGTEVNAEASNRLLEEIMRGFPARDEYELNGRFVRTFAIGEGVGEFVDENPLYPGRPLRPDGTCDQTNRSWAGVPISIRQLVYLAIGKKGTNIETAHNTMDLIMGPDAEKKLRTRYSKIAIELDELIASGNAPTLKIKLGANPSRTNDPFQQKGHKLY